VTSGRGRPAPAPPAGPLRTARRLPDGLDQEAGRARRRAPRTYSSRPNAVSTRTCARPAPTICSVRLDAVDGRHADVHQHHVGLQGMGLRQRDPAVRRLSDDRRCRGSASSIRPQAGPDRAVVVGQQDPDSAGRGPVVSGRLRHASPPGSEGGAPRAPRRRRPVGPLRSVPPSACARSRIDGRPTPPYVPVSSAAGARPVDDAERERVGQPVEAEVTGPVPWRIAFVSASW
jgi:hypothetical protein